MSRRSNCQHAYEEEMKYKECIYCGNKIFKKSNLKTFLYVFGPEEKEKELRTYKSCITIGTKSGNWSNQTKGVLKLENPNDEEDVVEYECDSILFQVPVPKLLTSLLQSVTRKDDNSFAEDEIIHKPSNVVVVCACTPGSRSLDGLVIEENGLIRVFYEYLRSVISKVKEHQFKYMIEFGFAQLPLNSESVVDLLLEQPSEKRNPDTLKNTVLFNGFTQESNDLDRIMNLALKTVYLERSNERFFNLISTFVVRKFSVSRKACLLTNQFHFVNQNYFSKKELLEHRNKSRKEIQVGYGDPGDILTREPGYFSSEMTKRKKHNDQGNRRFELLFQNSVLSYMLKRKILETGDKNSTKVVNLGIISGNENFYSQTRKIIDFMMYSKDASQTLVNYY